MAFTFKPIAAAVLALSMGVAAPAMALDAKQKEEIGQFIKEYLIQNPEIMLDVQNALQAKQEAQRTQASSEAVAANKKAIFSDAGDMILGNPKGDVTVVEFFDYNCGYCKHALSDMNDIIGSDKNVRFVLKELPRLGPDSMAAHKVSAAFKALGPEKSGDFHRALLGGDVRATEERAIEVATSLGVSEGALRKQMTDKPNDDAVKQVYQLAGSLGITGTPSYVIGNEAVFGAVGSETLQEKIDNVRSCGKTMC